MQSDPPSERAGGGEPKPAVLSGVVERVLFERPETGYRVLLVCPVGSNRGVVVVGILPEAGPGELITAEGGWYDDKSWGRQFRASRATVEAPATEAGLVAYLSSGRIKGVGEELARRLVTEFGLRLGDVIEREPLRLRDVEGVGPRLAARLQEAWQGQRRARDTLVFLAEHGFSATRANRIVEAYGLDAVQTIRQDPYALARDVRGIGFATADRVALRLGIASDSVQRIGAAMGEVLRQAADAGDTAVPREEAEAELARLLAAAGDQVASAVDRECAAGRLALHQVETGPVLMLAELDRAERLIADRVRGYGRGLPPWTVPLTDMAMALSEHALGVELAPTQREAIALAIRRRLLVITGGPGTGKTTLVRGILAALEGSQPRVVLAAPTGRAARRARCIACWRPIPSAAFAAIAAACWRPISSSSTRPR